MRTGDGWPTMVILGSGSLGRAVVYGLSAVLRSPVRVVVTGRGSAAAEVCQIAGVRANASGVPAVFVPMSLDLTDTAATAELLAGCDPTGVLLCASSQSPWEGRYTPSAWTALLDRAGIGLSAPFHAEFAAQVGAAVAQVARGAFYLNACFPDAVNPLLAATGVPVLAGVGNVAVLAACVQAALGLTDQRDLAVLAHHVHLHAPAEEADDVLVWRHGEPVPSGPLLAAQRRVSRQEANQLTGYLTALLLRDLLDGRQVDTHLPGPAGLPGGYPVRVGRTSVVLRLPAAVDERRARALNERWGELDGVTVRDGRVWFGERMAACVADLVPELADGFSVGDLPEVRTRLGELRAALRTRR